MNIKASAREWYALQIVTAPAVTSWDASFDGGATYTTFTAVGTDGYYRWLVAGPTATPGSAKVLPLGRTHPLIRATDTPEIVVRDAPSINVSA